MPALWFCLVALQGASNRIFVGRGFSRDIQPFRMRAALAAEISIRAFSQRSALTLESY